MGIHRLHFKTLTWMRPYLRDCGSTGGDTGLAIREVHHSHTI